MGNPTDNRDENPFFEKDAKKAVGSAKLSKYDAGIAARLEKQIKATSSQFSPPKWENIYDTHHSQKDNKHGR